MQLTHLTLLTAYNIHTYLLWYVKNTLSPLCQKVGNKSWFFEYFSVILYAIVRIIVEKFIEVLKMRKLDFSKKVDKKQSYIGLLPRSSKSDLDY